jgi:hypothetical protein
MGSIGSKGPVQITARRPFGLSGWFIPQLVTDALGEALVDLVLADASGPHEDQP